ncbi:transmembrane protein stas [Arctopsyche grandis]|uniref:transmembrane protein stas n=1 Tax=Arctopsyche grandis TaxID=121162 RepID=UPI00406DA4BF
MVERQRAGASLQAAGEGQRLMGGVPAKTELSTFKALSAVAVIFLCSILALAFLYSKFPDLSDDERQHIKIPLDIEEAKQLGLVLDRYKEKYLYEVMSGVFLVYIFLQSFAIPGSMFLSILSGFLFPFVAALTLVCTCSAIGASLCFLLSHLLGKKLVKKYCPQRAAKWAVAIEKNKGNLLYYMIFLRVTPFLPNWFINLTAPIIGVPLVPFALGTFIGVAPPSFVAIQAGQTLHTLTSSSDAWSWTSVVVLSLCAGLSLIPVVMKNKLKAKFE